MNAVPERVGIIGGGRMGVGIAHAFLLAGATVTILERDSDAAAVARAALTKAVAASVARETVEGAVEEITARALVDTDAAALADSGLVVEAVPEVLDLKRSMLARVEGHLGADAWIASNTSSISIDQLAGALSRPERLFGLHFFNPVPSSALVEIVSGKRSLPAAIEAARGWVEAIGKTAIVVQDSPGFASSRLGVALALEAMRMVDEGVASAEDIDTAMVLGYRHPTGPLRTTDLVGLDVRLGIAEYLASTLGERFEPPAILRRKVAEGKLGRKTGEGFFLWNDQISQP